jgi:signal transduction histidine kinase
MHAEQMRNLTSLSAEIAQELRAPLASIAALADRAREQIRQSGSAADGLRAMQEEAVRMQQLLEEFLNFSRPLSPLSLHTVDGVRIGGEVVDLFQGAAEQRQLSLALSGERVELRCDPRKIKQVLVNLVQNALEASPSGGEIAIEVESETERATIRVLDRGHGLAAEIAERVFQPGVTTKPRGSGLGLTIARSIAEQHGGTLILKGREGGGCAAELTLPVSRSPAAAEGRAA